MKDLTELNQILIQKIKMEVIFYFYFLDEPSILKQDEMEDNDNKESN